MTDRPGPRLVQKPADDRSLIRVVRARLLPELVEGFGGQRLRRLPLTGIREHEREDDPVQPVMEGVERLGVSRRDGAHELPPVALRWTWRAGLAEEEMAERRIGRQFDVEQIAAERTRAGDPPPGVGQCEGFRARVASAAVSAGEVPEIHQRILRWPTRLVQHRRVGVTPLSRSGRSQAAGPPGWRHLHGRHAPCPVKVSPQPEQ